MRKQIESTRGCQIIIGIWKTVSLNLRVVDPSVKSQVVGGRPPQSDMGSRALDWRVASENRGGPVVEPATVEVPDMLLPTGSFHANRHEMDHIDINGVVPQPARCHGPPPVAFIQLSDAQSSAPFTTMYRVFRTSSP